MSITQKPVTEFERKVLGYLRQLPGETLGTDRVSEWSELPKEQVANALEKLAEKKCIAEVNGNWVIDIRNELELERLKELHNPENMPTGHFTGRCMRCHSTDLWSGQNDYGCNCCGAFYMVGDDVAPRVIDNETGADLGPAW